MYRGSKNFKKILLTIKNQRINFIPITEGSTFSHCSGWKKFCSAYMLLDVYFSLRMEQPLIISGGRPAAQAVVSAAPAEMHWLAPAEEVRAVLARRGDLLATCPWQGFLRPSTVRCSRVFPSNFFFIAADLLLYTAISYPFRAGSTFVSLAPWHLRPILAVTSTHYTLTSLMPHSSHINWLC